MYIKLHTDTYTIIQQLLYIHISYTNGLIYSGYKLSANMV